MKNDFLCPSEFIVRHAKDRYEVGGMQKMVLNQQEYLPQLRSPGPLARGRAKMAAKNGGRKGPWVDAGQERIFYSHSIYLYKVSTTILDSR